MWPTLATRVAHATGLCFEGVIPDVPDEIEAMLLGTGFANRLKTRACGRCGVVFSSRYPLNVILPASTETQFNHLPTSLAYSDRTPAYGSVRSFAPFPRRRSRSSAVSTLPYRTLSGLNTKN